MYINNVGKLTYIVKKDNDKRVEGRSTKHATRCEMIAQTSN